MIDETYTVEYRHDGTLTLFETDELTNAVDELINVVNNPDAELLGFSDTLDGALDFALKGVKLFDSFTKVA